MKFALFYEIPVARPWAPDSEHLAYKNTLEQAIAGEAAGFHAFWTVEHHFLEEYSHCSNPEVLYGAIASRTTKIRLGYGVRLMPKPYNHPVRTAESVAVLDLLSDGRVDMGTGRSATRIELEGFGIDPKDTREMWREAIQHVVGCWTNERYSIDSEYWTLADRRVQPKPLQQPHPPIWGATTSDDGHAQVGELGLGLCSFAVGVSPEEVKKKIDIYRASVAKCTTPIGKFVNNQAATFTMAVCAPTDDEARTIARESFEWYPKVGARQIAQVAEWMAERKQALGNYDYAADMKAHSDDGSLDLLSLEYLIDSGACVLGTPDQCIESCKRYEAAGVDLLLCLVNPYKIPHEKVMQTIDLMGTHVIPRVLMTVGQFVLLDRARGEFERRLELIAADQWTLPTPCAEWDVRGLVNHVVTATLTSTALIHGATREETVAVIGTDVIGDDPIGAFARAADGQAAAFAEIGALEMIIPHPAFDMAGAQLLEFRIGDMLVHAWDLARATGGDETLDPELVAHVYAGLLPLADALPASGAFGEGRSTELAADATEQWLLLDLCGRRP